MHRKFGTSIGSTFIHVDFILRWHDKNTGAFRRYLSTLLCAVFLPRMKYDVILSEGPHFIVGLQRWLHLLSGKKKTIALLDNETLYFIDSGFYKERTRNAFIKLIRTYDGIISAGKMEAELARKYAGKHAIVKQIFNGIEDSRLKTLLAIRPEFKNRTILFIGNIGAGWRAWYKGVDLLFESFELAWQSDNALRLQLIGEWDSAFFEEQVSRHAPQSKKNIGLVGYTKDLNLYLQNASLYVHPARGEAWGISVTEAMAAGIMPLVSNATGSREVVEKVDAGYILPLDKNSIAAKITEHFSLTADQHSVRAEACKKTAAAYSETSSVQAFQQAFAEMTKAFDS